MALLFLYATIRVLKMKRGKIVLFDTRYNGKNKKPAPYRAVPSVIHLLNHKLLDTHNMIVISDDKPHNFLVFKMSKLMAKIEARGEQLILTDNEYWGAITESDFDTFIAKWFKEEALPLVI